MLLLRIEEGPYTPESDFLLLLQKFEDDEGPYKPSLSPSFSYNKWSGILTALAGEILRTLLDPSVDECGRLGEGLLVKGGRFEKSTLEPKEVTWDWMRELASGSVRPEEVRERRERWIHCFRGK